MDVTDSRLDLTAPQGFGVSIRTGVNLAGLTTMKVGGDAQYFATVTRREQLIELVQWACAVGLPYFILGGGSNILISDRGIRGLVIENRCREVSIDGTQLQAQSGAATAGVARVSVNAGLTGLEWAVSVPGTIGGAVVNNAGAHGGEVKDNLRHATLVSGRPGTGDGTVSQVPVGDFAYAYRSSSLKQSKLRQAGFKPVVVAATFELSPGDRADVRATADRYLAHRRRTQPSEPSLGSTFVNPPNDYAGRLIEAAGLKGRQVGGVAVSATHANFIVNPGGVGTATAADVIGLIKVIQQEVEQQFGLTLEPEVQLAGEWDEQPWTD